MEKQLSPGMAELKEQFELINAHGISPEKMASVADDIINGDLNNPNFKRSDKPLIYAEDKHKEAERILNNYTAALKTLVKGKETGDDETKTVVKFGIIVGAASSGLTALGFAKDDIDSALGLVQEAQ